jgi:hypothetical protein
MNWQSRNQSSAGFQTCRVAGFQTRKPHDIARPADLEIGDTAGLETCATLVAVRARWVHSWFVFV